MKRKRHTPEQIIRKLCEADAMISPGKTIGQVCQNLEVREQTFHRWRNQCGGGVPQCIWGIASESRVFTMVV